MGGQDDSTTPLPPASSIPIPGIHELLLSQEAQNAAGRAGSLLGKAATDDARLGELGAGSDPDYVNTFEHFEGMTHAEIYEAVHGSGGMDAAGMRTLQQVWLECSTDLLNLSAANKLGLNRIFGSGAWQGTSADAAEIASTQFANGANQIGQVFRSVNLRLDAVAWAAEAVRTAIQPPPAAAALQPDPDNPDQSVLPGLINPDFADNDRAAKEVARQEAVRAMNALYKPNFPPAGTGVPSYIEVPGTSGDNGTPGVTPSSGLPNGSDVPAGTPPAGNAAEPAAGAPAEGAPQGQEPTTGLEGLGLSDGSGLPQGLSPGADDTTPASTTPAGLGTTSTLPPNSSGPGTSWPGGPGASEGTDRPGRSPADSAGPGSSRPGASGAGTGLGAGTAGAGSRPGAGGRGMPMAPMGQGGRRGKEDDAEHFAPDYLRGVSDEWTEGLGSSAGVIGENTAFDHWPMQAAPTDWVSEPSPARTTQWPSRDGDDPITRDASIGPPEAATSAEHREADPSGDADFAIPDEQVREEASDQAPERAGTHTSHTSPTSGPPSSENVQFSGTGPMMNDPAAAHGSDETFTASGTGPVMDDPPLTAETTAGSAQFTASGTGPVMDDAASNAPATPAETETFTVSGIGPIMDEMPGEARRQ